MAGCVAMTSPVVSEQPDTGHSEQGECQPSGFQAGAASACNCQKTDDSVVRERELQLPSTQGTWPVVKPPEFVPISPRQI
jgi:hypothetical protein